MPGWTSLHFTHDVFLLLIIFKEHVVCVKICIYLKLILNFLRNTTTPCPLSPSPGPSSQNNSSVASISSGSNSSVINMAVPCTLASIPIDMHEIAYQNLQQTTHLQGQGRKRICWFFSGVEPLLVYLTWLIIERRS